MRRASRRDANQGALSKAFEKMGCVVIDVAGTPCGFDIVVILGRMSCPVEIKDGSKSPSRRTLTENEKRVHEKCAGAIRVVTGIDDVIETVELLRRWNWSTSVTIGAPDG